jgi:hypothetical protein
MRLDFVAHVARPDHLVGADLDVLALEEIGAVLVAAKYSTRLPRALSALAIENSTALPRPPPASNTADFSGISVGVPVGPSRRPARRA